jgi:hypothetical protein
MTIFQIGAQAALFRRHSCFVALSEAFSPFQGGLGVLVDDLPPLFMNR